MERIKQVKYRYCRGIDTCDLALLKTVFTEDAEIDYIGGSYRFEAKGRDAILQAVEKSFHKEFVAAHSVTHPIIDVKGNGTATGEWRLTDYAINLREANLTTIGAAEYRDRYRLIEGQWRIARSTYTRIFERVYNDPSPGLTFAVLGQTPG